MAGLWSELTGGKQVNFKALLILGTASVVLGGAVHLLHGYQVRRNAQGLLEQADLVEKAGAPAKAADYLNQYLGLAPSDTEALARYGLLLKHLAREPRGRMRAYLVLNQALRRDSDRQDVRLEVARLAVELRRFQDAKGHVELLLAERKTDGELLCLLARSEAGLHQYEEAAKVYDRAIWRLPEKLEAHLEYALLLRGPLNRADEADQVVERMVESNPRSPAARREAARYFTTFARHDKAWQHVRFALDEPGAPDGELILLGAEVAQKRRDMAGAATLLQQGVALFPKDTRMGRALARLDLLKGDRASAVAHLEKCLDGDAPADGQWELANLLIDAGELARAREVIQRLGKGVPASLHELVEARLLIQKKKWGEARTLLEKARGDLRLAPSLARQICLLLGQCHERLGNPDRCLEAYRQATALDPHWLPARRGLAAALASLGKLEQAITEYHLAVLQAPELRETLARVYLAHNLRLPPAKRDWSHVDRLIADIVKDKQDTLETRLLGAEVLALRGKRAEARTAIEAERDRDPKQIKPWLYLVSLAAKDKTETALRLVDEAEHKTGKRVEWPLVRARLALKSEPAEAVKHLQKLLESLPLFEGDEQTRLLIGMAVSFTRAGDNATARKLWRQVAQREPENLAVQLTLFDLALADDKDEARALLGRIRGLEGNDGALVAYAEAALRLSQAKKGDQKLLAEAQAFLKRAASLRPSWSRIPLLEATLFELEGDKEKAIEKYQAALERGEGKLAVIRRTLALLFEQRHYAAANALLRKLPEQALATAELGPLASRVLLFDTDDKEPDAARRQALELARKTSAGSKDHRDFLWLGQLAYLNRQPKDAEKAFRQACALKPAAAEGWVALILLLAETDKQAAETELAKAAPHLSKELALLALAPCHEALGRHKQAEDNYQELLKVQPDDPLTLRAMADFYARQGQPAKEESLLRKLLAIKTPEPMAGWARRRLALNLTFQGSYARFREARGLLESGDDPADLQTKILLLAMHPAHRREALRLFEKLPEPHRYAADFRFRMAQLHDAEQDWRAAESLLLPLLQGRDKNPDHVAYYVQALLRQGRLDDAETWMKRLDTVPKAPGTVRLRVRVLAARKRAPEALALVKTYLADKDARPDLAAELLEELGETSEAEKVFRKIAALPKRPEAGLPLAAFLGRQGRVGEALEVCANVRSAGKTEEADRAATALLRSKGSTPDHQKRVVRWLREDTRTDPPSTVLLLLLAELRDGAGNTDETAQLYRQVLRYSKRHVIALNNLAYLSAMQGGDSAEALVMVNTAIEEAGPLTDLLDTRATVHMKMGRADLAIADLQRALAQAPSPERRFHLAQALHRAGNRTAAAESLRQAFETGLSARKLHQLERPGLQQLIGELGL